MYEYTTDFDKYERQMNSELVNKYQDIYINTSQSFISKIFRDGVIDEITADKLRELFSDPDLYQDDIKKVTQYYYIANAEVHQLYELIEVLPQLNYHINSFEKNKTTDKHVTTIKKTLQKLNHKRLTRDLLKQTSSTGNVVGIWLGDAKQGFYPYIFDNLDFAYPKGRGFNGEWICVLDMSWFDSMDESNRNFILNNTFKNVITNKQYDDYKKNSTVYDKRYIQLPTDRTFALRTGALDRNQLIGTGWSTAGLMDVLHKKKLKDVESTVANKIINAIAVLTLGSEKDEKSRRYEDLVKNKLHNKIFGSVKSALEKNASDGITVVAVPEFANLKFQDVNADGLDGKKYESVNSDIKRAFGISDASLSGEGGNFNSAKVNLEIFYKRIGVMLEDIESDVYGKLINLLLPSSQKDNFFMEYDKEVPLTNKEVIDYLFKVFEKGGSLRAITDRLGIDYKTYIDQTMYETEELQLQQRFQPYKSSSTLSSSDSSSGRPQLDDNQVTNENTTKTRTDGQYNN